jgi:hypothetical protein
MAALRSAPNKYFHWLGSLTPYARPRQKPYFCRGFPVPKPDLWKFRTSRPLWKARLSGMHDLPACEPFSHFRAGLSTWFQNSGVQKQENHGQV